MFLNSLCSKFTEMEEQEQKGSVGYMVSKIRALSRDELITVLKKRKHYQPEAVEEAVKEALRRGIIKTEEEVESPEFDEPPGKFSLFPSPGSAEGRMRLFRSLLRGLMIPGLIPVINGVIKFQIPEYVEGVGFISLGVIWIALIWFVMERKENRIILPLFLLLLMAMGYTVRLLRWYQYLTLIDWLVPVGLFLLMIYFLLYVRFLLRTLAETTT